MPIPYKNNAKKHSSSQVYKIALSIKDFGWKQPIVVDKDDVIIIGHGRWMAYEKYKDEMNLPEPRIDIATDLDEEKVKALRLADNLTASTDYDMDIVNDELSQLDLQFQEMLRFDAIDKTEKIDEEEEKFINDEGYMAYLNMGIKQIVLHYEQAEYNPLIKKCEQLLKELKLETNSDLFKLLVEEKCKK